MFAIARQMFAIAHQMLAIARQMFVRIWIKIYMSTHAQFCSLRVRETHDIDSAVRDYNLEHVGI
jgi:hypothetical protein